MKTKLVDLACPFALGNLIWARLPKCKELTFFRLYRILLLFLRLKELTSSTETGADSADGRAAAVVK